MAEVLPAIRAVPAVAFTLFMGVMSLQTFVLSPILTLSMLLVFHPLYYWCVFRPSLFPAWLAFLLGISIDFVSGFLGLNAFLLVFASFVIMRQRRYLLSQPFATQWAGFMFVSLSAELLRWLVMMGVNFTFFSPVSALVSAVCSAALYPFTALVMQGCVRLISPDRTNESLQD